MGQHPNLSSKAAHVVCVCVPGFAGNEDPLMSEGTFNTVGALICYGGAGGLYGGGG